MAQILKTKSIYFNDVNMMARSGRTLESRKQVPLELYRVFVSPMLSVVGPTFTKEAAKLGLSVCSPRYMPMEERINLSEIFYQNAIDSNQKFFIAIGLNESIDDLSLLTKRAPWKNILFDIANGYIPQLKERVIRVWNITGDFDKMMVGNVINSEGIRKLEDEFSSSNFGDELIIRVGIGNGGPCATSDETGINRGQITELMECSESVWEAKTKLVSDGGIYKAGYAAKAWAAGADYVLMGSYFSKALEAETHITGDGTYYGCASEKQNKLAGLDKHSEGKEIKIEEELKPLSEIVKQLWGGISSSITYTSDSVTNAIGNGLFEVKENSLPPRKRH